jgi:hypothetical protein
MERYVFAFGGCSSFSVFCFGTDLKRVQVLRFQLLAVFVSLPWQILHLGPDFFSHAGAVRRFSPAPSPALDSRTVLVQRPVRSEVFISFSREVVHRPRLFAVFLDCGGHMPRSRSSR